MKVIVAGVTGLAGSAIADKFKNEGHEVVGINKQIVDLVNRNETFDFIKGHKPDLIIDAAAKVGGIGANNNFPVDFLSQNLQIQTNLMDAAHESSIKKFIFLGSSCIYPRNCEQPIKEEFLLTGPLEPSNSAYAVAKIAGLELINSYRKQFGHNWISLMPTNLYGPKDNFNLESSHVFPALIRKFVEAKKSNQDEIHLWGTGKPKREFLHVEDLADAVYFLHDKYNDALHLNIGTGQDVSIAELANSIKDATRFSGQIIWDVTKQDGTPRKVLDISRLNKIGWKPKIGLEEGIKNTIEWYVNSLKEGTVRL